MDISISKEEQSAKVHTTISTLVDVLKIVPRKKKEVENSRYNFFFEFTREVLPTNMVQMLVMISSLSWVKG